MQTIDHKILLIEDEILYRMEIKRYLARFKAVYEADDLDQAFEQLLKHADIDLILLDLGLPTSEGADTVEQVIAFIREHNRVEDMPIIVLTGNTDPDVLQAALVAGAQEHLEKHLISGYVVEKTVHFAIRNKAREAVLLESNRRWRKIADLKWQQMTREAALMHELPSQWAYNELIELHKAFQAVPRNTKDNND